MIYCFIVIFNISIAAADEKAVKTVFNIEAQAANQSLTLFARQAKVELGFAAEVVENILTNPVKGEFESAQALELLLEGTGLDAEYGEKGIIIRRVPSSERTSGSEEPTSKTSKPGSLRLARKVAQTVGNNSPKSAIDEKNPEAAVKEVEEIVVTGTQIRGTGPVGANVITLDREYIASSGFATTHEILQSIPQNFGGGPNEETSSVGLGAGQFNVGFSSSINLRGLGTDSTLLLLNGRRSASGGGTGSFVDLNSVPASAIQRIEVLPDGASAIYGSDAIGGVVNVILRDDYEGAETRIRYAPDIRGIDQMQINQMLGKTWEGGNLLFSYEYYDRSSLKSADRDYTNNSDLTRLGGSNHSSTLASNPGNITRYTLADGTSETVQFAIPRGQDGTDLRPVDLLAGKSNVQNIREGSNVQPEQHRHSGLMMVSQDISSAVEVFAEARYSSRQFETRGPINPLTQLTVPNTNPFFVDPFGSATTLQIGYSFTDDYGTTNRYSGDVETVSATVGTVFSLADTWQLEVYGSYNSERTSNRRDRFPNSALLNIALADDNPSTAFNPFGDGPNTSSSTLAAIEGFEILKVHSDLNVLNVLADGEVFDTPGGAAKVAVGTQFRDESLIQDEISFSRTLEPVTGSRTYDLDRDVTAAFTELYLPFISEHNARPGIASLAVSIAGRYEDYSDFGSTFDPKFGISWSPVQNLIVRSTIGTSFKAPLLPELTSNQQIFLFNVPDPASPTGTTQILLLFANSKPDLDPQEGTTWTAGFDVKLKSLDGLRIGLTYFNTEVDNLIRLPSNSIFAPLRDPEVFAPIITRNPDLMTVNALLNDPSFVGTPVPADEIGAIVDFRLANLARVQVSGLDFNVAHSFDSSLGSFDVSFYASHLFEFREQLLNGPLVNNINTLTKPNSLKVRGRLDWTIGSLSVSAFGNHIGDYIDTLSSPNRNVTSWTTWDVHFGYDFNERHSGVLEGAALSLSVQNLFNADPPFVDGSNGVGYDAINANATGRFIALQLRKEW